MRRVTFSVHIDLDEVPGDMHTPESAQEILNNMLRSRMTHYNPVVVIGRVTEDGALMGKLQQLNAENVKNEN